jgi:hypothetical protein
LTVQLDRARIAIRYRTKTDVIDLALKVIRVFAGPLLAWLAAGAAPMFFLNRWLLADLRVYDFVWEIPFSYMFLTAVLVFLEMPLVTALITLFLGQAVFLEKPNPRSIVRDFFRSLRQLIVFQVLLRPISIFHPFLNEVILLERNPLRNKRGTTTWSRSRELHRGESSDLVVQGFIHFCLGLVLFGTTWFSLAALRILLLGDWDLLTGAALDRPMYTTYYHLLLWTIVGYTAVLRFLSYLNLRIRREGWDVELQVRAERARMARQVV